MLRSKVILFAKVEFHIKNQCVSMVGHSAYYYMPATTSCSRNT
nr:MAG TPA: hypothetical protein [Caudoviricetes sp.]